MTGQPVSSKPARLFFADNLRVFLTVLVVLHHLAVIYAANTSFYYIEPSKSMVSIVILTFFQLFNQAYFMGLFFFLSGYFAPGSYDRKGAGKFALDRVLRLGIPLAAYYFLLGPVASFGQSQLPAALLAGVTPSAWRMGVGPLWFLVLLLVFDLGYLLWRKIRQNKPLKPAKAAVFPKFWLIALFIAALAIVSYLVRVIVPFSKYVLFFPSLAYLPQYVSFFALGTIASRKDWLRTVPAQYGKRGFIAALISLILFLVAISAKFGSPAAYLGNGTWQSAVYALWDSVFSAGICLALVAFFRRFFDHQTNFGRSLAKGSLAVYIIHCPVITLLAAFVLRNLHLMPLLKFGLAAVISVPVCFGIAWLIRKIPGVKRVI